MTALHGDQSRAAQVRPPRRITGLAPGALIAVASGRGEQVGKGPAVDRQARPEEALLAHRRLASSWMGNGTFLDGGNEFAKRMGRSATSALADGTEGTVLPPAQQPRR